MSDKQFGIWGGTHPYGWVIINSGADNECSGTREECERTVDTLRKEYPDTHYEIVPFDPQREPEGKPGMPSDAQASFLRRPRPVAFGGALTQATIRACLDRGWVRYNVEISFAKNPREYHNKLYVITNAGRESLRRYDERTKDKP